MTISRSVNPADQFFINSDLENGLMYYFESGTNDPKTTFADVNEQIPNTHPVKLDGSARLPNVWFSGSAKQILATYDGVGDPPAKVSDANQIWERDPVTAATSSGQIGVAWDALTIFNIGDVAELNDVLYVSITNGNQNNNPASSPTDWTQFDLLKRWNTNETYKIGDPVTRSNKSYISLTNSNTGNDPASSTSNWRGERTFSGAVVNRTTAQSIPDSSGTIVSYDAETLDTDLIHDNSVNNSRLTVPTGVTRVKLYAQVSWPTSSVGIRTTRILKNGSDLYLGRGHDTDNAITAGGNIQSCSTPVLVVTAGDFFEHQVFQNSGGALNVADVIYATYFTIEVVQ